MTQGFIFDYGGTLDTDGYHWGRMIWHAFERAGVAVSEADFREAYVYGERAMDADDLVGPDDTFRQTLDLKLRLEMSRLVEGGRWQVSEAEVAEKHAAVLADLYNKVKSTTRKNRALLEALGREYPLVLVSNFYGNLHRVLVEFGLDAIFREVIESAAVGIRKPDPRIFQLGVDVLGLRADEVVVVGDSFRNDILPAKESGCHAFWLKGEGWTAETCDESIPDRVISSLSEIMDKPLP
ncbi:HAD family hydrolase [Prevotella sp. KH2C16]|uniref:HAD family hydrolase n=1 Tax=Prevotella sp. KH2C16 TaxID=1855325 RepID=UPI0008E8B77D|nr:HAD family hydrolase [Prevotella sp. KH2C16]SFG16057.1 putative hydrolase of the HAD superfamily [Prevotella sp. KH2C16]